MSGTHKIGAGSLEAMGRQGLKELRAALYPDSNIAREAEIGTYGTLTQGEIADQKADGQVSETISRDRHSDSQLDERMADLNRTPQAREPPERQQEIERD